MALLPTSRVTYGGVVMDAHTRRAVKKLEKAIGFKLSFSQGCFRPRTKWSGTTHMGAGTIDVKTAGWPEAKINFVNEKARDIGFASYPRDHRDGFDPHMHLVLIGCKGLSASAAWQVREYDAGRNALTNGRRDRYTYRPKPRVRFSWLLNRAVKRA